MPKKAATPVRKLTRSRRPSAPAEPVKDSGFSTPSLDRALAVLECIGRHPQGISLSEIAEKLESSLNFVYRVTQALAAHGYAHRDAEKRFRIGAKMLSLCQPVHDDIPLVEAALPALRWLSAQTGEAAHLGIITGAEGLVLERVIGTQMVKFYIERGTRFPLHTSAPGKAMLACMPEEARESLLNEMTFEAYHPWTLANAEDFRKHLELVRRRGWAADVGEHLEGHHCQGSVILDGSGEPVASLWITGPSQRLTEERMVTLAPAVIRAGRMVTEALSPSAGSIA